MIRPERLRPGDTIGVFTPSAPANVLYREKYLHGISVLKQLGFKVREGELTAAVRHQGYRSGTPQERAAELMGLVLDFDVRAIVSAIGGANSSSLIPYLDFDAIRAHPKIICGYSDVTALHLSILKYAGLSTFYGPAVMPSFGEWPTMLEETRDSFLAATQMTEGYPRALVSPKRWSRHLRRGDAWKTEPRKFEENPGWRVLHPGEAEAPIVVANLNTLLSCAGTPYFPELAGKILLIEQMSAPFSMEERLFRQLERMGAFEVIEGLIIGKPEMPDSEGAPFTHEELILEILIPVLRKRPIPVISSFDCGHTNPMLTIAELTPTRLQAKSGYDSAVTLLAPMVA